MKAAILHYHLNPGGVSRIIEMQLAALRQQREIEELTVFSGAPESSVAIPPEVKFVRNPDLNYLNCLKMSRTESALVYRRLLNFLSSAVTSDTIIHAHNLNLGKNPVLTAVLNTMLEKSYKIVNHIHDFAEDRPANMQALEHLLEEHFGHSLKTILYPVNRNCRYAVLNSEYVRRLKRFGVSPELIHLLPNPVAVTPVS
ncbi:MAG: hypothetical protein PHV59_10645, partial [Victivallales bacterium]|nr:hypothetical protein [Victivallales bacterium]